MCKAALLLSAFGFVPYASGQADRFGATPAEVRATAGRITALEADFAGLSQRYGVPRATLRAIARGQIRATPTLGGGELRETVRRLAQDAAKLRSELSLLRAATLDTASNPDLVDRTGPGVSARLTEASALIDRGALSAASEILAGIAPTATARHGLAGRLWVDVVKATALTQFLAGDLAAADNTLRAASTQLKVNTDDYRWELEFERGLRLVEHGHATQDMQAVAKAVDILENEALPLSSSASRQRLRTLSAACAGRVSLFSEAMDPSDAANALSTLQVLLNTCGEAARNAGQSANGSAAERGTVLIQNGLVQTIGALVTGEQAGIEGALDQLRRGLAMLETGSTKKELRTGLVMYGDALAMQEGVKPDHVKMRDAIRQYDRAVTLIDRGENPDEWASLQQRIAGLYFVLATRDKKTETFRQAIAGYRRAGEVFTRAFSDPAWARNVVMIATTEAALAQVTGDRSALNALAQELRTAVQILTSHGSTTKRNEARDLLELIEAPPGTR